MLRFCTLRFCVARPRVLLPCLLSLCATACNAPTPASPADGVGPAPVQQDVASVSALAEDGHGEGYEFHIRYPELQPEWNALNQALRAYAAKQKQEFRAALPAVEHDAGERAGVGPPAALDLEFDVARRTEDFVSVLARETVHAGASNPKSVVASFVLHPASGKLLSIVDLFTIPNTALHALSDECRRQLEGRYEASLRQNIGDSPTLTAALKRMQEGVERGTAPDAANFAAFLIDGIDSKAIGLAIVFPQTQLAASSDGEQQVEVPAKVFYEMLQPEYRDAFAIDTEELKQNAH
jgi:hypothetical protein